MHAARLARSAAAPVGARRCGSPAMVHRGRIIVSSSLPVRCSCPLVEEAKHQHHHHHRPVSAEGNAKGERPASLGLHLEQCSATKAAFTEASLRWGEGESVREPGRNLACAALHFASARIKHRAPPPHPVTAPQRAEHSISSVTDPFFKMFQGHHMLATAAGALMGGWEATRLKLDARPSGRARGAASRSERAAAAAAAPRQREGSSSSSSSPPAARGQQQQQQPPGSSSSPPRQRAGGAQWPSPRWAATMVPSAVLMSTLYIQS
ncbi:unnamed protein product [Lampetra fluviatilis]